MKALRILIADDHEVVRRGVRAILLHRPGWSVCGEAQTGREAVERAAALLPDVVLMDVSMPGLNGLEAVRELRRRVPTSLVVMLTVHESEQMMSEFISEGVGGYVLKAQAGRVLIDAIDAVSNGKTFFTPTLTPDNPARDQVDDARSWNSSLTSRERQILRSLAEGRSNKEVAAVFAISTKTVETHRARIMKKLHLHSTTELVRYAIRHQLIEA